MEVIARHRAAPEPIALDAARSMEQVRDPAMFLLDRHGRAASWNEGVRLILGWDRDGWLGQPVSVAFTAEDIAAGVPELELHEARADGHVELERWLTRRDGKRFFAACAISRLLDDEGRLIGFLKILRDQTAQRCAAAEREQLLQTQTRARAEAQTQAAALTAAIEAMPDGVCFADATGITRCNAAALRMFGFCSAADLQHDVAEWATRLRLRRRRDGALLDPAQTPLARALGGEVAALETWATRPDGQDVFIRGTAAPIIVDGRVVGAVAVNSDLTEKLQLLRNRRELKHAVSRLRQRDEELRALVECVRDYAIFTIDTQGRISSWHEGAALMKGYRVDEAIGMPFECLFTAEDRGAGLPAFELEQAARHGELKTEGPRRRKDGSLFDAAGVLTALRAADGALLGYLKLTHDISRRKQQEREREAMLRAAERANESKREFLATISHELRTPLTAILGWTHVLERGLSDAAGTRQGLAAIERNARAQLQLMEDLLDMSRIEAGQMRLEKEPVELEGIVAAAIDSMRPVAAAKGVELQTALDAGAGMVDGDAARLHQVVCNLLGNAIKFTPAGGHAGVALRRGDGTVELAVDDDGEGIAEAFLPHVFEHFQQQEGTTTRRHGGLGIGLSIVRQLVQLHGGSVHAHSAGRGLGSTFTVTLPASDASPAGSPAGAAPAAAQASTEQPLRGVRLLLVDDEPDGRAMAALVFGSAGAHVLAAASAEEALALFRAHRPAVIVSDIGMPLHDGYELMQWIRSIEAVEGGHAAAAAYTAYATTDDLRHARAAGYEMHLVKPVDPPTLVAAVARLARSVAGSEPASAGPST